MKRFLSPANTRLLRFAFVLPASIVFSAVLCHAETAKVIPSKIEAVTAFQNQAEVVRTLQIPAAESLQAIRVIDLPIGLLPDSVYTESESGTTVQSLRIVSSELAPSDEASKLMKEKDDAFKNEYAELVEQRDQAEHRLNVIEQDLLTLEKLVDFSSDKAKQNLDRATLDVDSVTSLAEFTMQQRRKLAEELFQTRKQIESLFRQIETNREQKQQWVATFKRSGREAVIDVLSPVGGEVRLVYSVDGVSWKPSYTVRAESDGGKSNPFSIQFDGVMIQNSGEDWTNVELTLSTTKPQSQSAGPRLTPLRINTSGSEDERQRSQSVSPFDSQTASLDRWYDPQLRERDVALNADAGRKQINEFKAAAEVQRTVAADAESNIADESYEVSQRINLQSRPEEQTIVVFKNKVEGDLYHVATPLLSSFAYREAKLTNSLGRSLIAGETKVFLKEKYIGQTTLPPTVAGQDLIVGFGVDRQLRTRRELLTREESIRGGNRHTDLEYRLVVSNFHTEPIDIRLLDRIPITPKDTAINVELNISASKDLSDDALYLRIQRPLGILRWDLSIPARRFGSNAFDFDYEYSLEMDREQSITGQNMIDQMQTDYRFDKSGGGMGGGMGGMGGGGTF